MEVGYGLFFKNTGEGIAGALWGQDQVHHRPYLRHELHGKTLCDGHTPPGGSGRYGMGRTSLRDQVDARWVTSDSSALRRS